MIDTYTGRSPEQRSPENLRAAGYTHIIWNLTLREGWDEPLAYVAYLDQKGKSTTDIVQKIGRFVRQPSAEPFADPDLNAAYFYFNVEDEEFIRLIKETQAEMEFEGYEVIQLPAGKSAAESEAVTPKQTVFVPTVSPWFGNDLQALDEVVLKEVTLFDKSVTEAKGSIQTRVLDLDKGKEDVSQHKVEQREHNAGITVWDYITMRLAAIDSRIVQKDGTSFSVNLRDHQKMRQEIQFGSEAMGQLSNAVLRIRDGLDGHFRLARMGRHSQHEIGPFRVIAPNALATSDATKEKYRVRTFVNALHAKYNALNPFELKVAYALDQTGHLWCRNSIGKSDYRIPIPELGAENIWFYPDFLVWHSGVIWAIDPKGKHLLEAAVARKLLNLEELADQQMPVRVAFIVEGSWSLSTDGRWAKVANNGVTLVRRQVGSVKPVHFESLAKLMQRFLPPKSNGK